jgi:chorismate synthase
MTDQQIEILKKYNIDPNSKDLQDSVQTLIKNLEKELESLEKRQKPIYETVQSRDIESNIVRCPNPEVAAKMIDLIEKTSQEKDSIGGTIQAVIRNCPIGLGQPEFDKLPAELAKAMMSINATKGFEIGSGFKGSKMKGSQHNDLIIKNTKQIKTLILDFGGVLFYPLNSRIVTYLKNKNQFEIADKYPQIRAQIKKEYKLSSISKEYLDVLKQLLKKSFDFQLDVNDLYDFVNQPCFIEPSLKAVKDLSNKFDLYYLTNANSYLSQNRINHPEILKYFKGGLSDSQINYKYSKPDIQIYKLLQDKYNLDFDSCLFVDDLLENVQSAQKLGLQGIHFKHKKTTLDKAVFEKIKEIENQKIFQTNNAGGVLGGLSSGQDIYFKVAIKPVATIAQKQKTVDKEGREVEVEGKGRHDPCVLPRAVPIVEAMSALVIMDMYLRNKSFIRLV